MFSDKPPSSEESLRALHEVREELTDVRLLYEATLSHSEAVEHELALRNEELKGLSQKLSRYLAPQVYDAVFSGARQVEIQAVRKRLTVFFADIVDFTSITDSLEPEDLSSLLNEYLSEVTAIAQAHGATVNKYIGDAVMAFFGDPDTAGEKADALRCVEMALAVQRRLRDLRRDWASRGVEKLFHCRVGINTGYCTVGNFGSANRMEYTAIGSAVNLAARIQGQGERDCILVSHSTSSLVGDRFHMVECEPARMKGFAAPVRVYRVIDTETTGTSPVVSLQGVGYDICVEFSKLSSKWREDLMKFAQEALAHLA